MNRLRRLLQGMRWHEVRLLEITVPGTLSNLGPGYDALGMAVSLLNRFQFEFEDGFSVNGLPQDPDAHLTLATARDAAVAFGVPLAGLQVVQHENVPRARGLGSSATARVAGLLAALSRTSLKVPLHEQLSFLAEAEGHPDNVVPAMVGGLTIVGHERGTLRHVRLGPPRGLLVALCVPHREVETAQARRILPAQVSHTDACFNVGRMAFLMAGLLEGRPEALLLGVQDRLHQPWRAALIGPVAESLEAAAALGGMGGFISGSGSTLACFVPDGVDADAVADAMCGPFHASGLSASHHAVRPVARGALIS